MPDGRNQDGGGVAGASCMCEDCKDGYGRVWDTESVGRAIIELSQLPVEPLLHDLGPGWAVEAGELVFDSGLA